MRIPVSTLAKILNQAASHDAAAMITAVTTDSRSVKQGDCFFAIKGANFDGHKFIEQAFAGGAVCAVVNKDSAFASNGILVLAVEDTILALGKFAAQWRSENTFKVIAITGSVGKTTTRQIVTHVLSSRFDVHQSPKNFNNNIGLPLTLLSTPENAEIIVTELGTNAPGEIEYLTKIVKPDIALITNVHPAHLERLKSIEGVAREKLAIAVGLTDGQPLILNGDCQPLITQAKLQNLTFITYGLEPHCDIKAENVHYTSHGSEFYLDGEKVCVPLPGPGNVENALAAFAICSRLGMDAGQFAHAVEGLKAVTMRSEILRRNNLVIINDCYNANPASMKNALHTLANLAKLESRRKVFVCGQMGELGASAEHLHEELGKEIADNKVDVLMAVGPFAAITARKAKQLYPDIKINMFNDSQEACKVITEFVINDDAVLVKGSRSTSLETVTARLMETFTDKEVAEKPRL